MNTPSKRANPVDPDQLLTRLAVPAHLLRQYTPNPTEPFQTSPQTGLPKKPTKLHVNTPEDPDGELAGLAGVLV